MDKINGYGRTELPTSSRSSGVKRPDQGDSARSADSGESTRTDAVALTDTAVRLKRIETSLADLPEVDQVRVDALKEKISAGNYEVSGKDVARRLIQMEQDLA